MRVTDFLIIAGREVAVPDQVSHSVSVCEVTLTLGQWGTADRTNYLEHVAPFYDIITMNQRAAEHEGYERAFTFTR